MTSILSIVVATLLIITATQAQSRPTAATVTCRGPIYSAKEVTRRAKIIEGANLNPIYGAFGRDVHGRVVVDAVLCRSGHVTDIKVIESSPATLGEFVAAAVSLIRFTPAEMNWHSVSQRQSFDFLINEPVDIKNIDPATAAGRLIENLDIIGYRRISKDQILSWIKTRPGDPYNFDPIQSDLKAILASGYFDKTNTRVYAEEGERGGVGVVFMVVELPLVNEIRFQGLRVDQSVLLIALDKELGVRVGAPFSGEESGDVLGLIKRVLESDGQHVAKVEVQTELINAMSINLMFIITNE